MNLQDTPRKELDPSEAVAKNGYSFCGLQRALDSTLEVSYTSP